MKTTSLSLKPKPPFRLDFTAWALRRRPENIIDRWDGEVYRRVLVTDGQPFDLAVTQVGSADDPEIQVVARGSHSGGEVVQSGITAALQKMFGLETDLSDFYQFAKRDAALWPLIEPFLGFKPPRFATIFEALVNGIACQQVTLTQGIRMLSRLAEAYGIASEEQGTMAFSFPEPEALATREIEDFRRLSFSGQKARALIELADGVVGGRLHFDDLQTQDDDTVVKRLMELRGVGRWTAEYVLLRGLGRTHVFPGDDVGARNNLKRWLGIEAPDYQRVHQVMERFQPYGGIIYFHLLLNNLTRAGYISPNEN